MGRDRSVLGILRKNLSPQFERLKGLETFQYTAEGGTMKIKVTKISGTLAYLGIGSHPSEPLEDNKPVIIDTNGITICDSLFNTARCIVRIEEVPDKGE